MNRPKSGMSMDSDDEDEGGMGGGGGKGGRPVNGVSYEEFTGRLIVAVGIMYNTRHSTPGSVIKPLADSALL